MAAPVLASKGTASIVTTNAPAPTYPASVAANDIVALQVVKYGGATSDITTPANFNLINKQDLLDASGVKQGVVGWYYRRATGALSGTVTVTTAGSTGNSTVAIGQLYRITGCRTTGDPFETNWDPRGSFGAASAVTWDAIKGYHSAEAVHVLFSGGGGALTQPPATPTGVTATTAADSTTTGADGYLLAYTVTTDVDGTNGPYASSTSRVTWATLHIMFVSAAYVGQTQKSGTDTGGAAGGAEVISQRVIVSAEDKTTTTSPSDFSNAGVNVNRGGVDWFGLGNIGADDGTTSDFLAGALNLSSNLLWASFDAFTAIPAGATINGIAVEIDISGSATGWADDQVLLVDGLGNAVSGNFGTSSDTNGVRVYGGPTDKWGLTPTPSDFNSGGIAGVQLGVTVANAGDSVSVDYVKMTVYYTYLGSNSVESGSAVPAGGGSTPISGSDTNSTTTEAGASRYALAAATDQNGSTTENASYSYPLAAATDQNGVVTEQANYTYLLAAAQDQNGATTENASYVSPVAVSDANGATTENSILAAAQVGADANGATTEAASYAGAYVGSDSNGATTENASYTSPVSVTDANGATSEISSLAAQETGTDANGTTQEATSLVAAQSGGDSSGVITESGAYVYPLTGVDSGASSDDGSLAAAISLSDSGSDSEASTLSVASSGSDANGATTENSTAGRVFSAQDQNGATTETASVPAIKHTQLDSGVISEAIALTAKVTGIEYLRDVNKVTNPNFETDVLNWNVWGGETKTRDTATKHSGAASMKVVTDGSSGSGVYGATKYDLLSGEQQTITVWVLAPNGQNMTLAALTPAVSVFASQNFVGTGAWQQVTLNFTPDQTGKWWVFVRMQGSGVITYYVDDVSVSGVSGTVVTENGTLARMVAGADVGASTDAGSMAVNYIVTDLFSGIDTGGYIVNVIVSDSGNATEDQGVNQLYTVSGTDTASSVDTGLLAASFQGSQSGSSVEGASVPAVAHTGADNGSESVTGASVSAAISAQDTAQGQDAFTLVNYIIVDDQNGTPDEFSKISFIVNDEGSGVEFVPEIPAALEGEDFGYGTEIVVRIGKKDQIGWRTTLLGAETESASLSSTKPTSGQLLSASEGDSQIESGKISTPKLLKAK